MLSAKQRESLLLNFERRISETYVTEKFLVIDPELRFETKKLRNANQKSRLKNVYSNGLMADVMYFVIATGAAALRTPDKSFDLVKLLILTMNIMVKYGSQQHK